MLGPPFSYRFLKLPYSLAYPPQHVEHADLTLYSQFFSNPFIQVQVICDHYLYTKLLYKRLQPPLHGTRVVFVYHFHLEQVSISHIHRYHYTYRLSVQTHPCSVYSKYPDLVFWAAVLSLYLSLYLSFSLFSSLLNDSPHAHSADWRTEDREDGTYSPQAQAHPPRHSCQTSQPLGHVFFINTFWVPAEGATTLCTAEAVCLYLCNLQVSVSERLAYGTPSLQQLRTAVGTLLGPNSRGGL